MHGTDAKIPLEPRVPRFSTWLLKGRELDIRHRESRFAETA